MASLLLRMTPAAKADLSDIRDYTRRTWGDAQAIHYMNQLREQYRLLQSMPYSGKPVSGLDAELRMLQCSYHCAFYIVEPGAIQFIAFLHERMEILRHLAQRLPSTPH